MSQGDLVKLRAYGEEEIIRRIVLEEDSTVYVCMEEEYQAAINEGREPVCVGFPMESIIERMLEVPSVDEI